jgi:hypothetical protein
VILAANYHGAVLAPTPPLSVLGCFNHLHISSLSGPHRFGLLNPRFNRSIHKEND